MCVCVPDACSGAVLAKDLVLWTVGLIGCRSATHSVGKCVGESPVGISFLFREIFPALCTSAFFSSLLSASVRPQAGYGHFAEVCSQLQPYTSEQPSGGSLWTSVSVSPGTCQDRSVGNVAAQGEGHRTSLEACFLPLEGLPGRDRVRTQRLSLQSLPGAQQAGTRRLGGDGGGRCL